MLSLLHIGQLGVANATRAGANASVMVPLGAAAVSTLSPVPLTAVPTGSVNAVGYAPYVNPDIYFSSVVLLAHMDGADAGVTFTDVKGHSITVVGNTNTSTAQSVFGGASAKFDGNGDYLTLADSSDFEFGSGDLTMECRVRFAAYPTVNDGEYRFGLITKDVVSDRGFSFSAVGTVSSLTSLMFEAFDTNSTFDQVSGSFTFSLDTWYAVAVVKVSNTVYLFVDGTLLNAGGTSQTKVIRNSATTLKVGAEAYNGVYVYYLNGYMDEVRITKSVGRYTANYTVRTDPFQES